MHLAALKIFGQQTLHLVSTHVHKTPDSQVVTVFSWCFFQVSGKDQCANCQCLQKSHGHYWQLCAPDDRDNH